MNFTNSSKRDLHIIYIFLFNEGTTKNKERVINLNIYFIFWLFAKSYYILFKRFSLRVEYIKIYLLRVNVFLVNGEQHLQYKTKRVFI